MKVIVSLELVYNYGVDAYDLGSGFSHIAIQVENLESTLAGLTENGIAFEAVQLPAGADGPKTSFLRDPDGYRLELVEWPPGHPDGITIADFD